MLQQKKRVLPDLAQKWYGSYRAVRTDGAAHGTLGVGRIW